MDGDDAGDDGEAPTVVPGDEQSEIAVARARAAHFEQKAAEYRRVLDAAPDPVFAFTRTGQYVYVNHDFARTVSLRPDDIIGKTLWDIFPKSGADARFGAVQQVLQTGEAATIEVTVQQPTGPRHFLTTAHPVRADGGEVTAVVCSSKDITDRRRAEASKVQLEAQLHHAQKMESVGRLAGGVAHDFNNLLGVILGNLEFVLEKVDPSDGLFTDLREIQKAAERSASLTQQLLAFARRQAITARVLDLNEAIGGTLSMLRRIIGENVQLEWQPGATPCTVKVDPSQIDQILANLCVNGRDAIGGSGTLTITTGRGTNPSAPQLEPEGGASTDEVWLAVRDDGCGMEADLVAHIFEPFFTTKPLGQGTGLGLATVYGIVNQNGGRIGVESAPRKGTTFTVHLPRHAGTAESLEPCKVTSLRAPSAETILVVDDEATILAVTKRILEQLGYTVLSAQTAAEAISLARSYGDVIRLLVTDVVLRETNGRALAKELVRFAPNLRVLYMSGYAADVVAVRGVVDEGLNLLAKPFTRAQLTVKVRAALDRPELAASA